MRKFTPNPRTVQEAFDELKRDGLIETVRGHATRVARRMPFEGRYLLFTKARDLGLNGETGTEAGRGIKIATKILPQDT